MCPNITKFFMKLELIPKCSHFGFLNKKHSDIKCISWLFMHLKGCIILHYGFGQNEMSTSVFSGGFATKKHWFKLPVGNHYMYNWNGRTLLISKRGKKQKRAWKRYTKRVRIPFWKIYNRFLSLLLLHFCRLSVEPNGDLRNSPQWF